MFTVKIVRNEYQDKFLICVNVFGNKPFLILILKRKVLICGMWVIFKTADHRNRKTGAPSREDVTLSYLAYPVQSSLAQSHLAFIG